jgi:tetratricopeptide (TPR) repeat protein
MKNRKEGKAIFYFLLINVGIIFKKYDWVERICRKGIKVASPKRKSIFHEYLGKIYYKQNELDRAIEEYKKAINLFPESLTNRLTLIQLLFEKKRYEEVIKEALQVLYRKERGYLQRVKKIFMDTLYWYLAYSYYNLSQYKEAIPWFEKLLNYKGKEDHYLSLAYSYQMAENYEQAIYYYEKAIKEGTVKDGLKEAYLNLGFCHEKLNDIQNAI